MKNKTRREELGKAFLRAGTYLFATGGIGAFLIKQMDSKGALIALFFALISFVIGTIIIPTNK